MCDNLYQFFSRKGRASDQERGEGRESKDSGEVIWEELAILMHGHIIIICYL